MIANRQECVEPDEVAGLLAGSLPAERFASLLRHIESCQSCIELVEKSSVPAAAPWISRAASAGDQSGFQQELECQAIVGQLLVQPFARSSSSSAGALPIETLGPYRLVKWLGSGGMGAVYLAEHQRLKRLAAIKLLPREKLLQSGWLERFNREMMSIAALEHPHVVRAMDAGDEGGWHYLVMEYLDGLDLSRVCRRMGPLPLETACEVIRQAALGLGAIHELGMTHRDVKPSNLFLTKSGCVKLLDLGLVLSGDSPLTTDQRLTTVGHLMGTLPFMAREQLLDASCVDWRADIYSLGATFLYLLTGRAPFSTSGNLAQTIQAISTTDCVPVRSMVPDLPGPVAQLIDRMLSHDPRKRPQSATEIVDALAESACTDATSALIRVALNKADDESTSDVLPTFKQPSMPAATRSGVHRWRFSWGILIALMLLPLAFASGIYITVATDKGTLVIESEEPGVSVSITQGDKLVDSLQIDKQPKTLRLSSGKYVIELQGVEGENLQVSDAHVVLMRGDKQVVKVTKRQANPGDTNTGSQLAAGDDANSPGPVSSENTFQGKPLSYWLGMLDREKDVKMLGEAMQALGQLAETDQEQLTAAKRCLAIARRLGGLRVGSRNTEGQVVGGRLGFMTELTQMFPRFFPEPGLQAIIEELEQGNKASLEACLLLLGNYPRDPFSALGYSDRGKYFASMAADAAGVGKLQRLDAALEKHGNSLTHADEAYQSIIPLRFQLVTAMGKDPSQDQQLVSGARARVNAVDEAMGNLTDVPTNPQRQSRSPLTAEAALMIRRILPNDFRPCIILGLLEFVSSPEERSQVAVQLQTIYASHPTEVRLAIVAHLNRSSKSGMVGFSTESHRGSETLNKIAAQALLSSADDDWEIVKRLMTIVEEQIPTIFTEEDLANILQQYVPHIARQSATISAPTSYGLNAAAIYLASRFGLPAGQEHETLGHMLKTIPPLEYNRPNGQPQWRAVLEISNGDPAYLKSHTVATCFVAGLQGLMSKYPAAYLKAYADSLEQSPYRLDISAVYWPLFEMLNAKTAADRRLDSKPTAAQAQDELSEFLDSAQANEALGQLEQAHWQALVHFNETYPTLKQPTFRDLNAMLLDYLMIVQFRHSVPQAPEQLRKMLERLLSVPDPFSPINTASLGLVIYYTEQHGYEGLPLPRFLSCFHEIARSENCGAITKLVRGVHAAQPEAFCGSVLMYLETEATTAEKYAMNKDGSRLNPIGQLFGGLIPNCPGWYRELVRPAVEDPKTHDRAIAALNRLINLAPPDAEQYLRVLLPKP